jgi:5-methylcytosine-specific restriction protein B
MIPSVPKAKILDALEQFDRELRPDSEWADWESNETHKYAIEYKNRRYPVKQIISMATGNPVSDFHGGGEANRYMTNAGFAVASLRAEPAEPATNTKSIKSQLDDLLASYVKVRTTQPFNAQNTIAKMFDALRDSLANCEALKKHAHVNIKTSYGKGNWASVPWISFLDYRETKSTQEGVYGVYLFREDMSGVYLAYMQGITDLENELGQKSGREKLAVQAQQLRKECPELAKVGFKLDDGIDLHTSAERGKSYEYGTIAHKLYETGKIPDDDQLVHDLDALLDAYEHRVTKKQTLVDAPPPNGGQQNEQGKADPKTTIEDIVDQFLTSAIVGNLKVQRALLLRFIGSLASKRFLILTGLSGSGKTKLAQAFALWLGGSNGSANEPSRPYALVPVGADWTGNENIIGYPDGLDEKKYVSRPALELILRAEAHPDTPHFLILDEMNLSHVERYFADLLSAMESQDEIPLYQGEGRTSGGQAIPASLRLPANLFVIGTVNVDETTYMFSPKVLDRANVLEFRMEPGEVADFLKSPKDVNLKELDGKGAQYGAAFVNAANTKSLAVPAPVKADFEREMQLLFGLLREHNAEFGYRTIYEAARFMHFYQLLGAYPDDSHDWFNTAMDAVIVQKLLPKLSGSRSRLEGLLWALALACGGERGGDFVERLRDAGKAEDDGNYSPETVETVLKKKNSADPAKAARYPLSFDKVMRIWRKLVRDQFASFAEA